MNVGNQKPKQLPPPLADPVCEQSVLGGILLRPSVLDEVAPVLNPEDFYTVAHGKIYQAMLDLYNQAKPIDTVTVTNLLKDRGTLEAVGGVLFVSNLCEQTGTAANTLYYARRVADKAVIRRVQGAATTIVAKCAEAEDTDDFLDWAEYEIHKIGQNRHRLDLHYVYDVATKLVADMEAAHYDPEGAGLITTTFVDLDNLIGGWYRGEMIILAARPSMGKTALSANIAYSLAKNHGLPVLFVSLEMRRDALVRRLIAATKGIPHEELRKNKLSAEKWEQIQEFTLELNRVPLVISDTAMSVMGIRSAARRVKAKHGNLGLVVVDYVQRVRATNRRDSNREREVAEISDGLKSLAMELNVPVIVCAQLNRKCEERTDKRPLQSDLRESGALEQDADTIAFIYRDIVYNKQAEPYKAELLIRKQRNGATGVVPLSFLEEIVRFDRYDFSEDTCF